MPTRDEMRKKIERDLRDRGVTPSDPRYDFVRQTMEDMNQGMADLDDELASVAEQLQWLANAPTWVNVRKPEEFDRFVEVKIAECEAALAALKQRWEKHKKEPKLPPR